MIEDDDMRTGPESIPGTMNTQTYLSVGLVVIVLGSVVAILNSIYSAKGEITARIDKVEWRMSGYEKAASSSAETWTDTDMFRWCVKLQKANPSIQVPEPEHAYSNGTKSP